MHKKIDLSRGRPPIDSQNSTVKTDHSLKGANRSQKPKALVIKENKQKPAKSVTGPAPKVKTNKNFRRIPAGHF